MTAAPLPFDRASSRWRRQLALLNRNPRFFLAIELGVLFLAIVIAAATWLLTARDTAPQRLLTPPIVALILVVNLVPVMVLMVLLARRVALRRAGASGAGGNGRLRVRLVAVFSMIASVPTLLVVVFASLLFQYGVEFWFSDRARTVLENAELASQAYVDENKARILADIVPMASDMTNALNKAPIESLGYKALFARQLVYRNLNEGAIIAVRPDGKLSLIGLADLDNDRPLETRLPPQMIAADADLKPHVAAAKDRVEATIKLDPAAPVYLYVSRKVDPQVLTEVARAKTALGGYHSLIERTRTLQLKFNAALIIVSLLIVGLAIVIAFIVADRIVRPVGELVDAARRVASGDMSVRVPSPRARDEVGTLAVAFNRMTRRLEEQTRALVTANNQLDSRRAFTEAVLSGVTAGVLSVDAARRVRLLNLSAERLLGVRREAAVNEPLATVAPELEHLLDSHDGEAIVQMTRGGEALTLAAKVVVSSDGHVLTFDDITAQLADQRRAAWADVARRIAHEIKNPLTPIQLAAERLQRRYGRVVQDEPATFERLTSTIVRQVGDLRRMVDEFSSFARMPKPEFRAESLADIVRGALFLHEVAHPAIAFDFTAPADLAPLVCDRRQLGQALTNCVKNAVEAVEARIERGDEIHGEIAMSIAHEGDALMLDVADNGVGLPPERERITEPYMTTRARGTGLGLAIVSKIVEEHLGAIAFLDREGGGTIVRITLDPAALQTLADDGGDPSFSTADDESTVALTRKAG